LPGSTGWRASSTPARRRTPPYETAARLLPKTLEEGLGALREDQCLIEGFGKDFIDYFVRIKEAELARYGSEVTEWEQKEYFELF
jgi:glutamine synthetase